MKFFGEANGIQNPLRRELVALQAVVMETVDAGTVNGDAVLLGKLQIARDDFGIVDGHFVVNQFRPNEICTPSKPSCAANGTACGSAPSSKFQSVTPMRSFSREAKAWRVARAVEARAFKQWRRVIDVIKRYRTPETAS